MTDKQLAEFLKGISPKELWIVTWNNLIEILFCPFEVKVKYDVGDLKKNQIVLVDEVKVTRELKTVYVINGKPYFFHHFNIL